MSATEPNKEPNDGRGSWASRNSATILGLIAVTLMILATVYSAMKH